MSNVPVLISGAYDFLGMNHYTTNLVGDRPNPNSDVNYESDQDIDTRADPCWAEYVSLGFLSKKTLQTPSALLEFFCKIRVARTKMSI